VVYGTRRIGKTTLLQEFGKGKNAFYFQARKADEKDNLNAFSREYRKSQGLDEHASYNSFSDAFDSIVERAEKQRMILIIDEIAYLCQKNKAIDYYLISRSGFTDEVAALDDLHIHRLTLNDLFQSSADTCE